MLWRGAWGVGLNSSVLQFGVVIFLILLGKRLVIEHKFE